MMNTLASAQIKQIERVKWWSVFVAVVALVVCVIGGLFPGNQTQFFRSYLVSYLFVLGIPHGCLVILMIYHLTGGSWGFLIRRILEAGTRTLPLMALLFLPLLVGLPNLYIWAQPEKVAAQEGLQHKQVYLNIPFFIGRAVLYFALWIAFAWLLNHWSRRQDETGDPQLAERLEKFSGIGLAMFGITITFASVDWIMSLQPAFRSTIFGPVVASGEILTAMAWALIILDWLVIQPPREDVVSVQTLNDLGNLFFTFLVIWGYLEFFQFMLIWMANLPYDIIWYLARTQGIWKYLTWALLLFHLVIPFFLLLLRDVKQNPRMLSWLAGLILFMHLIFLYYQVLPAFPATGILDHWMDMFQPLALGGFWLAYFLWNFQRMPLLPAHDPSEKSAIHLHKLNVEQQRREKELQHD